MAFATSASAFGMKPQTQTTSLFGGNQQQPSSSGPAFGVSTQGQTQPSLFGSTQNQQQPATTAIYLDSPRTSNNQLQTLGVNTQGNGFGGGFGAGNASLFGTRPGQQQQTYSFQGGMTTAANVPAISKNTKFNDLPEEMKRTLEQIETYIQGRVQISKDLHQRKLGEEPLKGQELIRNIHKDLINAASIIRNDAHVTQDLKSKVDQAVEDTIVATRIVDEFRNPPSGTAYRKDHAAFPLEFFARVTNQMKERLAWYKATIEVITPSLSIRNYGSLTAAFRQSNENFQRSASNFIALASKTAAVDAELQKIKTLYTQLWRSKTGSVRDPFNDLDTSVVDHRKGDFGMGGLSFR
ncbi:hypothetical protein BDQ17DRAFT_1359293 [Cyathus striatus]|nr:hypothetical protein BDQ17DRAFT_1359293 [Cyathus striatus]